MAYHDSAVRQRATSTTDRYGNDVLDWTTPAEVTISCTIQPADSSENVVDRDTVVTRYRLFCAPGTDVVSSDRLVWRGRTFEVDGDLEEHSRKGTPHHLEAFLRGAS